MSDIHLPRRNMRLVCPTCGLERHVPDDWREVVGVTVMFCAVDGTAMEEHPPMSGYAYLDFETTGLDPDRHVIWELAVIVDGVEHCWQQKLNVGQLVAADPFAQRLTRFESRYRGSSALSTADSLDRFSELTTGRHLVGSIPSFDEERIRRQWVERFGWPKDGFPWHDHVIDVEALAVGALAAKGWRVDPPWESEDLSRALGVPPISDADRHTALGDARWAKAIHQAVMAMALRPLMDPL